MSERAMRQAVCRALKPLHAVSIENPCRPGTPDVSYADGLLELKWARAWPARPSTPLAIPHYTPQQRLFHRKRRAAGGKMFVVLQVGRDWLLLDGVAAADRLCYADKAELESIALLRFSSPVQLLPWLKSQL